MDWFLIALIPPAVWAISNHFDKYLLSKYFKGGGVGALMVFSSIIGIFIAALIWLLHPEVVHNPIGQSVFIMLNGFVYILAVLPYFYALRDDEASYVVPLFQLTPILSYVLAWIILGEQLTRNQLIGGVIIITGAIILSLDVQAGQRWSIRKRTLLLMLLSSLLFSLNFLFFKYLALDSDFWTTSFWEYIGFIVFGVSLLVFIKSYRTEFFQVFKTNRFTVLSLNGVNEIVNIIAKLAFNYASLLAPITLTWIVDGFQPLFVFTYGILLTIFFPRISQEKIWGRHLVQKLIAISLMTFGAFFLK